MWDEKPELNITPLVDIMLVLLAILMITTPAINYEEQINLPQGSKKFSSAPTIKSLIININAKKEIIINNQKFNFANFVDNFNILKSQFDTKEAVYIRADKNLLYDDIVFVLKSIKDMGFARVALQTE